MMPPPHGSNHGSPRSLPEDVHYVDTPEGLEALVERVKTVRDADPARFRTCLDTEADSLHHFQEKLCLLQMAFGNEFALIDPLALPDMNALIEVLDAGELWFHGADYDLTLLKRTYGWVPTRLRDTQIAARLTGSRQFGLAALIENHFGHKVSKASQKADWSRRPLSSTMLHYAVDDVRFLLPMADRLMASLTDRKRMDWFLESCQDLRDGVASRSSEPKEDPWRVQGSGRLTPKGLAFLRGMWLWRDKIAQERDVPVFRIISNKQILDLALTFEADKPVLPPAGWRPRWKRDFEQIVEGVSTSLPETWPQKLRLVGRRYSDAAREQLDLLCQHREKIAQQLDLEPSLLGARSVLEDVVADAGGIESLLNWQRDVFGQTLHEVRHRLGFAQAPAV